MNNIIENYLESVFRQFQYYKLLGEKTFMQLSEEDLLYQHNEESNSIAVIVNHLSGNMLSRWTNFLEEDGEKEWRNREQEFEQMIETKVQLLDAWEKGWNCLFDALNALNEENFNQLIYIRNQGHTVMEAINRQLAHYSYHIGQVVYLGRLYRGAEWESLSIPKGKSAEYNRLKFAKAKNEEHFTDEYLNNDE